MCKLSSIGVKFYVLMGGQKQQSVLLECVIRLICVLIPNLIYNYRTVKSPLLKMEMYPLFRCSREQALVNNLSSQKKKSASYEALFLFMNGWLLGATHKAVVVFAFLRLG